MYVRTSGAICCMIPSVCMYVQVGRYVAYSVCMYVDTSGTICCMIPSVCIGYTPRATKPEVCNQLVL